MYIAAIRRYSLPRSPPASFQTKASIDSRPMSDTPVKYYRSKAFGHKKPFVRIFLCGTGNSDSVRIAEF